MRRTIGTPTKDALSIKASGFSKVIIERKLAMSVSNHAYIPWSWVGRYLHVGLLKGPRERLPSRCRQAKYYAIGALSATTVRSQPPASIWSRMPHRARRSLGLPAPDLAQPPPPTSSLPTSPTEDGLPWPPHCLVPSDPAAARKVLIDFPAS